MYAQSTPSSSEAALTARTTLAAAKADEIPATHLAGASLALLRVADALDTISDELELHAEMIRQGRYHELVEFDAWAAGYAQALAA